MFPFSRANQSSFPLLSQSSFRSLLPVFYLFNQSKLFGSLGEVGVCHLFTAVRCISLVSFPLFTSILSSPVTCFLPILVCDSSLSFGRNVVQIAVISVCLEDIFGNPSSCVVEFQRFLVGLFPGCSGIETQTNWFSGITGFRF